MIQAFVSYKLTENQSISKAGKWINREEVRKEFNLKDFEERMLFRVLEIVGETREEIMLNVEKIIFEKYKFEHTNTLMDWTSLVLYGEKEALEYVKTKTINGREGFFCITSIEN